jgi:hypothetical protein
MKSISEINNRLKELNTKYKKSGLTDGKISHKSAMSIQGKKNADNGLLKKIGKIGGKVTGKNAHKRLNESQTFESRSKAHKKSFDKSIVEESLKVSPFNKYRAQWLGVTQVTYTKILKEHGLYVKELAHERFMKYLSEDERSKLLNKHKNIG